MEELVELEQAVNELKFPSMREEVIEAVRALSDRAYQEREWGRSRDANRRYDDLDINVHILYDDTRVLPDPSAQVGIVLFAEDVPPLRALEEVLGPLIDELGDVPDREYLANPRWNSVLAVAARAADEMTKRE